MTSSTTGAGQTAAYGPTVPVTAGTTYTAVASFQATGPSRRIRAGIAWLNAQGTFIGRVASSNVATVDSTTNWTTSSYSAVAPAGAVAARAFPVIDGPLAAETHLVDRVGLVTGNVTETWTDPATAGGQQTYHVVAYRIGDGENSAPARIALP